MGTSKKTIQIRNDDHSLLLDIQEFERKASGKRVALMHWVHVALVEAAQSRGIIKMSD